MATCPKCGKKLRLYHWRPECPACGANMVYYKSNERLLAETEKTEIEHAKFQPRVDRAKAAFFGSPWAIARVVLTALPLGGLMLPLCRVWNQEYVTNVNAVTVYQYLSGQGFGSVFSSALKGDPLSLAAALLLVSAAMILVCLICTVMSLGKHGVLRNLILNLIQTGSAVGAAACFSATDFRASLPEYTAGALSWGGFVCIALFAALLVYNLYLAKRGLPVKKTVCYIGGLPSDEYFQYVEQGMSELEIRKKMVEALTKMQNEVRARAAEAEEKAREEKENWK